MKVETKSKLLGTIIYDENFWTGQVSMTIDGRKLTKVRRGEYSYNNETIKIKGNVLSGVTLHYKTERISLMSAPKWYELVCSIVIFAVYLVWSHTVSLVEIIPVIGGMIGGALAGLTSILNLTFMRKYDKVWLKLLIWIGMFVGTFAAGFLLAVAMVGVFE